MEFNQRNYIFQTNLQTLAMGETSDSVDAMYNIGAAAKGYSDENPEIIQKEDIVEEGMEVEDIRREPIDSDKVTRCKSCRRMKYGHPKPYGQYDCNLKPITDDEELKKDDEEKNKKRLESRKRKFSGTMARKTPEKKSKTFETTDYKDEKVKSLEEEKLKLAKLIDEQNKKKEEINMRRNGLAKEIKEMKKQVEANDRNLAYTGARSKELNNKRQGRDENTNKERQDFGRRGQDDVNDEVRERSNSKYMRGRDSFRGNHGYYEKFRGNRAGSYDRRNSRGFHREERSRYHDVRDRSRSYSRSRQIREKRRIYHDRQTRRSRSRSQTRQVRESSRRSSRTQERFSSDFQEMSANMLSVVREISDKRRDDKKLDPPPSWDETMSPEAWARHVRIWNKAEVKPYRKAQALIEDLKKNEKRKGLKEMIVNEIVENADFDLESNEVIEKIISKVKDFLQDSRWSRTIILANEFCKLEQLSSEDNRDFVTRFGNLETKLKNEKVGINSTFLAATLLNKSKMSQSEKNNILANFDLENDDPGDLLKKIKKKIRDLDATRAAASTDTAIETHYGDYRDNGAVRERERSKTKERSPGGTGYRGRSYDYSRRRSYDRKRHHSKQRSNSRQFRSRSRSKSHRDTRNSFSDPKRTYNCDKFQINMEKSIFENNVENQAVLDSGCPEMVGGIAWLKTYEHSLGKELQRMDKVDFFKFGDMVYQTEMYVKMPLQLGRLKETVEVGIVKANIPLLISKLKLKEWGGILDFSENTLYLKITDETINLKESQSGHLTVNVGKTVVNNKEEMIKEILIIKKSREYSMMKLKKLHRVFGHPCQEKMELLMKDAGEMDSKIMRMLRRIQETCRVCLKFKRKASHPKVGLAKAREVNETVSIDLKPVSSLTGEQNDRRQIVYIMDEFSRFTAAGISKNKESEEVVKIILNKWCLGLMGYPSRSFFADNGTEFKKTTLEDLSRRLGIKVELTPSYSPWSNGGNERRHGAINLTLKKLMECDKSLDLDSALQHAIWARNMEVGRNGQSPYQVVLGKSPALPGVTDGNVVTDAVITESEALRKHFDRQEKVRILYRQADSSRRLKDAEKVRIQPYHDQKYERGDRIIFLDKNDQWAGPAEVQGTESTTIFVSHNGNLKKVATSRARPYQDTARQEELGNVSEDNRAEENCIEEKDETDDEKLETAEQNTTVAAERRPKLGKMVRFRKRNDSQIFKGKVLKVGKQSTKNKDKCWIDVGTNDVDVLDFVTDIESWNYVKQVNFITDVNEEEEAKPSDKQVKAVLDRNRDVAAEAEGVFYLLRQEPVDVLAVLVPPSEYHHPEIQSAMKDELEKFLLFDAYEVVDDDGQETIDGRWVINKKEAHDGLKTEFKARWCLRGFKEQNRPRSDSPTVDRLSTKMFYAVAANMLWKVECIDVTAAFLQGKELDRDVYVVPPMEADMPPGKLWRMKKAAYGLYDASRRFYCEVVEFLISLGCRTLVGDESFLYYRVEGVLEGCITLHVDDFQLAGTETFKRNISDVIVKKFKISKREEESFKFTGVDVSRNETGEIVISQEAYKDSLEYVPVEEEGETEKMLSKEEFKLFRGASGKLQWLAEMTRPDLAYDCLEMSSHGKDATKKDLKAINKIIKKAKEHESKIKYSRIGNLEDLKILAVTDGAYLKLEEKTKSVSGRFIFLSNKEETKVVPLMWKSKSIPTVCKSAKDAETRAADKTIEDAIYVARGIREIYTGERGEAQIPVDVVSDSKPLIDSVNSSKQVDNKLLRPVIKYMKQMLDSKMIKSLRWCDTNVCVADILTKRGSPLTAKVMGILHSNEMVDLSRHFKKRTQGEH